MERARGGGSFDEFDVAARRESTSACPRLFEAWETPSGFVPAEGAKKDQ